jgi:hypothetical protein
MCRNADGECKPFVRDVSAMEHEFIAADDVQRIFYPPPLMAFIILPRDAGK